MPGVIHETAIIDPAAKIGADVNIGPFSVVGSNVEIGAGCDIGPRVSIHWTQLGDGCHVGANSVVGGDPQIYNWESVESWVKIGAGSVVNELTVIHRSMYEGGVTLLGDSCYIMAQCHVGHDCVLGNGVTVTTLAGLSGHIEIGDHATIGGAVGIHQFVRIGAMAMIGGMSRLTQDIPPYFTVAGAPPKSYGLNTYALKKHDVPPSEIAVLKKVYRILARSSLTVENATSRIEREFVDSVMAKNLVEFIKNARRGLVL